MLIQCMTLYQGCLNVVCMLGNFLSIVEILFKAEWLINFNFLCLFSPAHTSNRPHISKKDCV